MSSSSPAVIAVIRGLSRSTWRAVKALFTSRRSRPWSGGSVLSMCRSIVAMMESGSGCQPGQRLLSRGSASAARASVYPVIIHTGVPPGMITRVTGR
jgi:hypothetical protein